VGYYLGPTGYVGFLLSGGKYTTISVSDSVDTDVTGVNQLGQIVGFYVDTAGNDHGYLYQDGRFTEIDFPGAQSTDVNGINAQGEIVGTYIDAQGLHAFTATAVPEPASFILLAGGLGIVFAAAFLGRGRVSAGCHR
jgi:probable HAF family extracellular repeat protein